MASRVFKAEEFKVAALLPVRWVLFTALLFALFWWVDSASAADKATVTGSAVNIRSGPGTGYQMVKVVYRGEELTVLGNSGGWYKVQLPGGRTGWIAGWLVKVKQAAPTVSSSPASSVSISEKNGGKIAVVRGDVVNVRSGPGLANEVVDRVVRGDELAVLGSSGGWYKVQLPGGRTGWIAGWLVEVKVKQGASSSSVVKNVEAVVGGNQVNIRNGPGTNYSIIGQVNRGDRLGVVDKLGNWYKVSLASGLVGWIAGWLVNVEPASASEPTDDGRKNDGGKSENGEPYPLPSRGGDRADQGRSDDEGSGSKEGELDDGESAGGERSKENSGDDRTGDSFTEQLLQLKDITIDEDGGKTLVTITADGKINYNIFTLTRPDRLVVDISGAQPGNIPEAIEVNSSLVSSFRSGSRDPAVVRLVFDLKEPAFYRVAEELDGNQLKLEIYVPEPGEFLRGRVVALDPGHGGSDPGAIGPTGLKEKDVNLDVALKLADLLERSGARVVLTRRSDVYVALIERNAIAARDGAEVFVSIHMNAHTDASKSGTSTFYRRDGAGIPAGLQQKNKLLAQCVQDELVRTLGLRNLGVMQANFVVLSNSQVPAILAEVAFISNPEEESLMRSESFRSRVAEAILCALDRYFAEISRK